VVHIGITVTCKLAEYVTSLLNFIQNVNVHHVPFLIMPERMVSCGTSLFFFFFFFFFFVCFFFFFF
jgi:hypothetical protein